MEVRAGVRLHNHLIFIALIGLSKLADVVILTDGESSGRALSFLHFTLKNLMIIRIGTYANPI